MADYHAQPIDFERRSKDPGAWFSVGFTLYYAAAVLWRTLRPALQAWDKHGAPQEEHELELRLRGPFAMLEGLAIENMLKGAIQEMTPPANRTIIKDHDLIKLAKRIDWPLSAEESDLLERLTRFVTWAGRYPVALDAAETSKSRLLRSADYLLIIKIAGNLHRDFHQHALPIKRSTPL